MDWKYALVFFGAILVDIVPIPLPPAFTLMVFLQIKFDLDIWLVIAFGVAGSVLGRFILTLYVPKLANSVFRKDKNEDVQFLGKKLKQKGWKSHLFVFTYSLMPLPTTPLFVGAGMARLTPLYIVPAFFFGKLISDTASVLMGKYAAENTEDLIEGAVSWKSIIGLVLGLILIFAIFFIDWRTLIQEKKLTLKFKIWK
jgi:membrane protein DedA with SNARE-associated domain